MDIEAQTTTLTTNTDTTETNDTSAITNTDTTTSTDMATKTDSTDVVMEVTDHPVGVHTGVCKWFNNKLGFGFISVVSDDQYKNRDIFCHHSGVRPINSKFRTLVKGEYINFDIEQGNQGPQAINITGILGGALLCDNNISYTNSLPPQQTNTGRKFSQGVFPGPPAQQGQQAQYAQQYQAPQYNPNGHQTVFGQQSDFGSKRPRT